MQDETAQNELSPVVNEIIDYNTPQTLGVTPRYMLQHNAITRGAHTLSTTAQKLIAMAMSLLPPDLSSLSAAFTFPEFCAALGYEKGGESYKVFREAVKECMQCLIYLETEPDEKGKKAWKAFTWFTVAKYDEKTGQAEMTFSAELAGFLLALKWVYSKITLQDIGRLQSRYAIRIFEIAASYMSLKGKAGNRPGSWYFERSVEDLRFILGVPPDAYKETRDFKRKILEGPVREINQAGLGVEIMPQGIKQGRRIAVIRFECGPAERRARGGRRPKKTEAAPVPGAAALPPVLPAEPEEAALFREDKELRHLKDLYQDEFRVLYEEALAKPHALKDRMPEAHRQAAEAAALNKLRERHGIKK